MIVTYGNELDMWRPLEENILEKMSSGLDTESLINYKTPESGMKLGIWGDRNVSPMQDLAKKLEDVLNTRVEAGLESHDEPRQRFEMEDLLGSYTS